MKNITIRRITERREVLYHAVEIEAQRYAFGPGTWRKRLMVQCPALVRYSRYLRYRRNLKRLGIG